MSYKAQMSKLEGQKWIDALRSGVYNQGKGRLKPDNSSYCCLGVYCIANGLEIDETGRQIKGENDESYSKLHKLIPTKYSHLGYSPINALIVMNDHKNKNFNEIADWIEENIEFI